MNQTWPATGSRLKGGCSQDWLPHQESASCKVFSEQRESISMDGTKDETAELLASLTS